jgi:hypothetical protein
MMHRRWERIRCNKITDITRGTLKKENIRILLEQKVHSPDHNSHILLSTLNQKNSVHNLLNRHPRFTLILSSHLHPDPPNITNNPRIYHFVDACSVSCHILRSSENAVMTRNDEARHYTLPSTLLSFPPLTPRYSTQHPVPQRPQCSSPDVSLMHNKGRTAVSYSSMKQPI